MAILLLTKLMRKLKTKITGNKKHIQAEWNTKGVMRTYNLPEYEASLIVDGNNSYEEFNKTISSMQNEFDVSKDTAIATLAKWAVEYHATKDIDDMVWQENNRLCGISDSELQT